MSYVKLFLLQTFTCWLSIETKANRIDNASSFFAILLGTQGLPWFSRVVGLDQVWLIRVYISLLQTHINRNNKVVYNKDHDEYRFNKVLLSLINAKLAISVHMVKYSDNMEDVKAHRVLNETIASVVISLQENFHNPGYFIEELLDITTDEVFISILQQLGVDAEDVTIIANSPYVLGIMLHGNRGTEWLSGYTLSKFDDCNIFQLSAQVF